MSLLEATRTSGPVGRFVGVTLHSIQPLQREREAPQVAPVVTCRRTEGLDDWCAGIRHISRAEDQNMGTEWRSDGTFRVGDWSFAVGKLAALGQLDSARLGFRLACTAVNPECPSTHVHGGVDGLGIQRSQPVG